MSDELKSEVLILTNKSRAAFKIYFDSNLTLSEHHPATGMVQYILFCTSEIRCTSNSPPCVRKYQEIKPLFNISKNS